MINWLVEQTLICSLLITLLLIITKNFNKKIGAINTYRLWLVIPISMLLPLLIAQVQVVTKIEIFKFANAAQAIGLTKVSHTAASDPLFVIWAVGALSLLVIILFAHVRVIHQMQLSPTKLPHHFLAVTTKLSLFRSSKLTAPLITGLFRKKLVIPSNFEQLYSRPQQELILKHELSHVSTKDLYWNSLALLMLTIFWFNPIFWQGYKRFRQQQELACDQRVLQNQATNKRQEYARAMLVASISSNSSALTYLNYNEEKYMKERIKQVNHHKNKSWSKVVPSLIGLVIIAAAGHSVFAHNKEVYQTPVHREAPVYPKEAYTNNVQGWVELEFDINTDGSVKNAEVIESSPDGVFDQAALNAIKKWRYTSSNEETINTKVQIDFRLEQSE